MNKKLFLCSTLVGILFSLPVFSQETVLKTNLLHLATGSPNFGIEHSFNNHWSIDAGIGYNPWAYGTKSTSLSHWVVGAEGRYWFRRSFSGWFGGLHARYARYNVQDIPLFNAPKGYRVDGHLYGGGLSAGYHLKLGKRWAMEFVAGAGYLRLNYDKVVCASCREKLGSFKRQYYGPTRAAISLIYNIGKSNTTNKGKSKSSKPRKENTAPLTLSTRIDTVFVEKVKHDTVVVEKVVPDTVFVEKIKHDTVFVEKIKHDTVFIEKIKHDTVVVEKVVPDTASVEKIVPDTASVEKVVRNTAPVRSTVNLQISYVRGHRHISANLANNRAEKEKLNQFVSNNRNATRIIITGYASPDGGERKNELLAMRRAHAMQQLLTNHFGLHSPSIEIRSVGEDWDGLRKQVAASNAPWRDSVLHIIDTIHVKKECKKALMELDGGKPYREMIRDIFPSLRKVCIEVER